VIVVAAFAATSKSSIGLPLAEPGARLFDAPSRVDARPVRFRRRSRCDHFSRRSGLWSIVRRTRVENLCNR
jgi:hypothetical protein